MADYVNEDFKEKRYMCSWSDIRDPNGVRERWKAVMCFSSGCADRLSVFVSFTDVYIDTEYKRNTDILQASRQLV